jgi:stage II sporulation protein AA (anti-sigma F factor antagonist)
MWAIEGDRSQGGLRMEDEVLRIGISESDNTCVLRLSGELDSYTSERLSSLPLTWTFGLKKIIVNLDGLEYIDSSGLTVLVGMWVKAMEHGIRLIITCRNPRINRIFEITGLLNLFRMDSSGPEARGLIATRYRRAVLPMEDEITVVSTTPLRRGSLQRKAI